MQNFQVMNKDYEKILAIIKHEDNEQKHLDSITNCILLFKSKFAFCKDTEEVLTFSARSLSIDEEYEKLKQKIYGTKI